MSEFEEAREAFRLRWGFDPAPAIESVFRRGEFDLEGGTEDERAFIREILTAGHITCGRITADMIADGSESIEEAIGLRCPGCGGPPRMVLPGGNQAFCGSDGCRILMWDPTQTRAEMAAEGVQEIDLSSWPDGGEAGHGDTPRA
jgi:hypothetical protein